MPPDDVWLYGLASATMIRTFVAQRRPIVTHLDREGATGSERDGVPGSAA